MSSALSTTIPRVRGSLDPRKAWRLMLLIMIYLFVLMLNGLDEFIRSGFAIEFVFTPEWWYKVFRVLMSNIFVFIGTLFYALDLAMRTNKKVKDMKNRVDTAANEHIDPVTFDPFYLDFERKRKIEFYKRSMETRVEKLESKAKMRDIELWQKEQRNIEKDGTIKDEEVHAQFLKNRYCHKKNTILKQLEPEFIEKHIGYMKVPYRPNSKSFVTNGYNKPSTTYDEYAVEPKSRKMIWDLLPKFILMMGFLVAGESVALELMQIESTSVAVYNMIIKIVPLMLQIYFAISYCDAFIEEKIMVDFRKRLDIIIHYVAYTGGKGVE